MNFKSILRYLILTFVFVFVLFGPLNVVNGQELDDEINTVIRRWPLPHVNVAISPNFNATERFNIKRTIRHFNLFSALRFYIFDPAIERHTVYLDIVKHDHACSTTVGYTGRRVVLNLAERCLVLNKDGFYGTLFHELGHVCGFCHVQQQPNRATWLQVRNIRSTAHCLHQYQRYSSNTVVNMALDEFEYGSIMSYPPFEACAQDPELPVIITLNDSIDHMRMGQRDGFTPLDWRKLHYAYYPNTPNGTLGCDIGGNDRIGLGVYYTKDSCLEHTVLVGSHGQYCTISGLLTGQLPVCLDKSPELAYTNFEDWHSFNQVFRDPRWYTWEKKSAKVFPSSWMTGDYTYYKLDRHVLMLNVANETARSETLRTHWWPLAGYGSNDFCIEFAAFFSYNPAHQFNLLLIAELQHPNKEPKEHETVGIISNEAKWWRFHSFTLSFKLNYTEGAKVAFGWVASSKGNITTHQWLALDNVRVHRNGVCANNTVWTNVD